MDSLLFNEKQGFKRFWIWAVLSFFVAIWFAALAWQLLLGRNLGSFAMSNLGLLVLGPIGIAPVVLFLFLRLKTEVRKDALYYRLWPVSLQWSIIYPEEIDLYYIKSSTKDGSKKQLFIKLQSGRQLGIGTQNPKQLLQAMHQMMAHRQSL